MLQSASHLDASHLSTFIYELIRTTGKLLQAIATTPIAANPLIDLGFFLEYRRCRPDRRHRNHEPLLCRSCQFLLEM
jgi:hypothetical protein